MYEQLRTIERTVDCVGVPLLLLLSDSTLVEVEVEVGVSRLLGNGGALEVVETGTVNSTASLLFFTDVLHYRRSYCTVFGGTGSIGRK